MKSEIRQLLKEWDESLHLRGDSYWKFEGITKPRDFFHALPTIFAHNSTLLFEGLEIGMSAKVLFEEYPAIYTREVACDGISPPLDCSHVAFTAKFSDFLCRLLDSQGKPNVFYHFKGYSETEVVFTFHDAFDGELAVSSAVSENAVREFGTALGCQPQLTRFPVDMYQQLVAIDRAMNPPWWKKLLGIGLVVAKD